MTEPQNDTNVAHATERFAERFELHELLGRGGMAEVYRATDLGSGRTVALKRLLATAQDERRGHIEMLFEREFYTLTQLSHPCVIEVYDYGVTPDGTCYYTMELLDGGALRERAPLPWRTACQLMFDVCSSLALLHSRRLLHRDISARNVHCTRDGRAKLIDFGAVAPMSSDGGLVVGTPAFTAPETVHRSTTDGRTDLYSFGATLYYALTGQLAYPARTFAELFVRWNERPAPPSAYAPDVPPALDDLVLSLLAIEPALRPPSAFAVMQRLAAIAGLQAHEADSVSRGYLSTPALTGREASLSRVRDHMLRALSAGGRGVMLMGPAGIGRSRMLDACGIEAKTLGARVLRANARSTRDDFAVVFALTEHLLEAMPGEQLASRFPDLFEPAQPQTGTPKLRELSELRSSPEQLERALLQLMREASKTQPLVFAVDDVQRIDEPSAAVLAALIDRFRYGRAFAVMTVETESGDSSRALDALSRRCEAVRLQPLTQTETQSLFGSVFGDVPNLGYIAEEIYALARGNPRASLDLAQHLVQSEIITYAAGTWTLPRRLSPDDLPRSAEAAIRARIEQLDPLARFLAHAHALSFVERLTHSDYRALAGGLDSRDADAAVQELLAQQALASDGEGYVLAHRVWGTALSNTLDAATRERAHATLAGLFEGRVTFAWIHHVLASESESDAAARAIDALLVFHANFAEADYREALQQDVGKLARSYPRALERAEKLGRPARQLHVLRNGLIDAAVASGEPKYYWSAAPRWLEQLIHDSGLDLWRSDAQNPDAGARLMHALTRAFERHQALPEVERVYPPDQAIRHLAGFVAISIAIGGRTMDTDLMLSLPALLEPFAPLSPVLAALWQNALGAAECQFCHYERARSRWTEIHDNLANVTGDEVRHVTAIRNAIAYVLGMIEAVFGIPTAARWADGLDQDPYQRVSALYLRKIVCLEQGDWTGAEKHQRSAELLALRARVPQMFSSTLTVEISAHALALDLAGVQDVIQRERLEAAQYPGWIPYVREAEARFQLIRGDFVEAKKCFDHVIALTALNAELRSPALPVWVAAQSGLCETLLGLERPEEARASALAALEVCEKLEIRMFSNDIVRILALAEAKLGDFASAVARLDRLITDQTALGVTGLRIGVTFEARAEVALWADDAHAFDTYARLTAREYRRGAGCPLSARYERLTREARRRGIQPEVALTDFEPATAAQSEIASLSDLRSSVRQAFTGAQASEDRYARALRLVCVARAAHGGHLFLPDARGPALAASCDLPTPAAALGESVREYLEEQEDRFETQTIAHADLPPVETRTPTAYVDGVEYELLLLISTTDRGSEVAGVIALSASERDVKLLRQSQLLATIAEQLTALRA